MLSRFLYFLSEPDVLGIFHLFSDCQEQPVTNITQARLDHALIIRPFVAAANKHLDTLGPRLSCLLQPILTRNNGTYNDFLDTPIFERLNSGACRRTCSDDWINDNGKLRRAGGGGRVRGSGFVVRQVIVVFDGLEGGLLAIEAEMVNGDGVGEDG